MKKYLAIIILSFSFFLCGSVNASIITIGFSGTISENYFDVPVGTIINGEFSYESSQSLLVAGPYNTIEYFPILSASISVFNETSSITSGYIRVRDGNINFSAGPSLGISRALGLLESFSSAPNGIFIGGVGFTLLGNFSKNVLPISTSVLYGRTGRFFLNRSSGELFDVDSPTNLKIPSTDTVSVNTPASGTLGTCVLLVILLSRRYR